MYIASPGIVNGSIIPCLKRILKGNISHNRLKEKIQALVGRCDVLKLLPLALCHIDLNARNVGRLALINQSLQEMTKLWIILDESYNIVGIIDWEQAALLPLGSNY